jgi:hypothetical protein
VGLKHWLEFPFVCYFPQNMDCQIGIGFEQALLWVTLAFLGILIVGTWIFPPVTLPIQILGYGISYLIVFGAVAWYFSPRCLFIFPSFPLPFGIGLPMCMMDDILKFLDKWITNCYSPLLLPAYMIAGNPCPTDPTQAIDFLDCRNVGVSDGITNVLFLGYWLFGSAFSTFAITVTSATIGLVIPGAVSFVQTMMNAFQTANPTMWSRMEFCFFFTLPSMLWPLGLLLVGGIAVAFLVPALLTMLHGLVALFFATPAARVVPGADTSNWYGYGDDGMLPVRSVVRRRRRQEYLAQSLVRDAMVGRAERNAMMTAAEGKQKTE